MSAAVNSIPPSWNAGEQVQKVGITVWDTGSLAWIKQGPITGGGGGGAVTIADGANVTQGTTTDVAWVSGAGTVISLLKKIASAGGSAVSVADGADVAQGAVADSAYVSGSGSIVSILKGIFGKVSGTLGISGTVTANAGTNLNTSALNLETTQALIKAKTDNLDVLLSTRTKPADQQHAIVDSGSITANAGTNLNTSALNLETTQALIKAKTDNLDVLLSTRTKPSDQQHAIVDSGSITANAGANLNTSLLALEAGHLATIDTATARIPAQGQATASASTPMIMASDTLNTIDLATGSRQDQITQILVAMLAQIINCDTNNVNITNGQVVVTSMPPVNVQATTPLPVTLTSLAPNAAQEGGGNLDKHTAILADMQQMIAQQGVIMQLMLQQQNQLALGLGNQPIIYQ